MFDIAMANDIEQIDVLKGLEPLHELADFQLLLVGGGTGAVNLE